MVDADEVQEFGGGEDEYAYVYRLTIPAGETLSVMNLVTFGFSNAEAETTAADFENIAALTSAGYLNDLTAAQINSIANFNTTPVGITGDTDGGFTDAQLAVFLDSQDDDDDNLGVFALTGLLGALVLRRRKLPRQ